MSTKKKITVICIAAVLLVLIIAAVFLFGKGASKTEVFVQKVEDVNSLNLGSVNRYSGLIETPPKTKVNFDSSKRLGELKVKEGDKVKKGQVLFTYDPESINIEIEQGELEIERLNTNIRNSTAQIQELTNDKKSASAEEALGINAQIQELQADISQSEYDIKTKESEIRKLKESASNISVKSPVKGTIDSIGDPEESGYDEESEYGGNENSDAFITIVESGEYRFKGRVSEQSVSELMEGTAVILRSRVDDTQYWKGTVISVDLNKAEDDENSEMDYGYYEEQRGSNSATFYDFYVSLESSEGLLLGQHVTCEIDYGQMEASGGIGLSSGWFVRDEEGNLFVWVASKEGGSLEKRQVTASDYNEMTDMYTIESGLSDDEYIAWPGPDCVEGAGTTTRKQAPEDQSYGEDMEGMEDFEGEDMEMMEGMEDFEGEDMEMMEDMEGMEGMEESYEEESDGSEGEGGNG